MRTTFVMLVSLALVLALAGCAAGPNELRNTASGSGKTAGFWQGIWHGMIAPFAFIISLFSRAVGLYEVHNNGNWYNFGFMLGLSMSLGGGGAGGAAARKRRRAES